MDSIYLFLSKDAQIDPPSIPSIVFRQNTWDWCRKFNLLYICWIFFVIVFFFSRSILVSCPLWLVVVELWRRRRRGRKENYCIITGTSSPPNKDIVYGILASSLPLDINYRNLYIFSSRSFLPFTYTGRKSCLLSSVCSG